MKLETYTLESDADKTIFEFVSQGPKGNIYKLIFFQKTEVPEFYNLAFGDKTDAGDINDLTISNNGDAEKTLATIIRALHAFFDKHPKAFVYATGSTPARTRLYRIGITKFYEEANQNFYLLGEVNEKFYEFQINKEYDGFLVQRKFL